MEQINLKAELTALLEKEVGFTGKFILEKQCQRLNIDLKNIEIKKLEQLAENIHWAIKGFTGLKKADEVVQGILEYMNAVNQITTSDVETSDDIDSVEALLTIGNKKRFLGLYEDAIDAIQKAYDLVFESDLKEDPNLQARVKRNLARAMSYNKATKVRARKEYDDVIRIGKQIMNPYEITLAQCGLGNISWRGGEYDAALDHYKEALTSLKPMSSKSKREKEQKKRVMAQIYTGLGNTYLDLLDMDEAIKYDEMAIKLFKELGDPAEVGRVYNNMARVYEEIEQYDKAIEGYELGISHTSEAGAQLMEGWTLTNLASALIESGTLNEVEEHLTRASRILVNFPDPIARSKLHCMYGKYFREKKEWNESLMHFNKSIDFVKDENSPDYLAIAQEELGILYVMMGNKEKARENLNASLKRYEIKREKSRIKKIRELLDEMD